MHHLKFFWLFLLSVSFPVFSLVQRYYFDELKINEWEKEIDEQFRIEDCNFKAQEIVGDCTKQCETIYHNIPCKEDKQRDSEFSRSCRRGYLIQERCRKHCQDIQKNIEIGCKVKKDYIFCQEPK